MAGIVIDFPGDDDLQDLASKLGKVDNNLANAGKSLQNLAGGGLGGAVQAMVKGVGLSGTGLGYLATGIASVATGIGVAINKAMQDSLTSMSAQYGAGASNSQLGYMHSMGDFLGIGAKGMSGMAQTLGDKLKEGGMASAWARSNGLVDLGPYTMNKMDNLTAAIDKLRKVQDKDYRMFLTRELLGADAAPLVEMSRGAYKFKEWTGKKNLTGYDETEQSGWAEMKSIGGTVADMYWKWMRLQWTGGQTIPLGIGKRIQDKFERTDKDDAIKENTRAIQDSTRVARNERIGSSARADRSWPKAWAGGAAEEALKDQARRLGGI